MTPHLFIESAIRASVLGVGAWGLLQLLRIRCPAQERVVWSIVLIVGALMPLAAPMGHRLLPDVNAAAAPSSPIGGLLAWVDVRTSSWPAFTNSTGVRGLLWPLYSSVVGVLLARLVVGSIMLWRLWREATPLSALSRDGVRVRSSRRVRTPVTIGAGILLPADWTQWSCDARERVLSHEKSHFERGDFYWQLLARAYLALFWASPLSWWLLRRLTLLAEHLSDDAAVAAHGGPADYAALLLDFSNEQQTPCLPVGMARRSELSRRVERILQATGRSVAHRPPGTAFVTGLLVLAVLSTAGPWFTVASSPATKLARLPALPILRNPLRVLEPIPTADRSREDLVDT